MIVRPKNHFRAKQIHTRCDMQLLYDILPQGCQVHEYYPGASCVGWIEQESGADRNIPPGYWVLVGINNKVRVVSDQSFREEYEIVEE